MFSEVVRCDRTHGFGTRRTVDDVSWERLLHPAVAAEQWVCRCSFHPLAWSDPRGPVATTPHPAPGISWTSTDGWIWTPSWSSQSIKTLKSGGGWSRKQSCGPCFSGMAPNAIPQQNRQHQPHVDGQNIWWKWGRKVGERLQIHVGE